MACVKKSVQKGGVHDRGHVWQGTCMAGGHAWQGGMHGRGHVWPGGMYGMHAPQQTLRDMVNKQVVHILLECILVVNMSGN